MTPANYAVHCSIFPCQWQGERRKQPLAEHGCLEATRASAQIEEWWHRWPQALIGMATGKPSGLVVLDIDVKHADAYGFDTLADLGFAILPDTPMVHTASGGLHIHFLCPDEPFPNTSGARGRGIGPGLDWRGDGGYVILPSNGSGYSWDPIVNWTTVAPVPVPPGLAPRPIDRPVSSSTPDPAPGLSPYAETALDNACKNITRAPAGGQETTLNSESFAIGTLAGAGMIPRDFALRQLLRAALMMPDHDLRRPWRAAALEHKVKTAFEAGLRQPRERSRVG